MVEANSESTDEVLYYAKPALDSEGNEYYIDTNSLLFKLPTEDDISVIYFYEPRLPGYFNSLKTFSELDPEVIISAKGSDQLFSFTRCTAFPGTYFVYYEFISSESINIADIEKITLLLPYQENGNIDHYVISNEWYEYEKSWR